MHVIVVFVQNGVTIHLLSPSWRLPVMNIVDCSKLLSRYTPKSQNKYAFTASTFLEALKFCNRIWNFIATVGSNWKSSILFLGFGKLLFTSADIRTSYVNGKVFWKCMVFITSRVFLSSGMNCMSSWTLLGLVEKFITDSKHAQSQSLPRFPYFFNIRHRLL